MRFLVGHFVVALLCTTFLLSQTRTTGDLSGVATDPSGAVVASATHRPDVVVVDAYLSAGERGALLVTHELRHYQTLYGTFASFIVLVWWLGLGTLLAAYAAEPAASQEAGLPAALVTALDTAVNGPSLYDATTFSGVDLSPDVLALAAEAATLDAAHLELLNRGLLDESYPLALAVAALAVADATVELTRVSVLGRTFAHRLYASDSILADFAAVDDTQDGCVRFSAYAQGSVLPRQYESAAVPAGAPLFTSEAFGQPGYGQLLETADLAVVGGTAGVAILTGAETASEMGAFSADLNPIKEQGLLIKYAEYMPLGLTPVVIHVT